MLASLLISWLSAKTFWLVLLRNISQKRTVSLDALGNFVTSRSQEEAWPFYFMNSNHNGGAKFLLRDFAKVRFAFLLSLSVGIQLVGGLEN